MVSIEDIQWLSTPQARQFWESIAALPVSQSLVVLNRARELFPLPQASLITAQFELLSIAKRKVSDPSKWFWTRLLLEQASDEVTARETAADFPKESHVHDICCGAGSDAIALSFQKLKVTAYDRCSIACELTRQNAASHSSFIDVIDAAAEDIRFASTDYINIDPDRRAEGRRVTSLEWLSPAVETIQSLVDRSKGLSLKLSPGLRIDWNCPAKNSLVPESIRYLSKDGAVKQQRWYWGIDRWPVNSIVVSTHSKSSDYVWAHEIFDRSTPSVDPCETLTDRCLEFIADYDPAIRAAERGADFAIRHRWNLIDSTSGYLTASQPRHHPMVRWFRLLHDIPMDRKQIKTLTKSLQPKAWELKSRGVEVDLDQIRKSLATSSDSNDTLTILFTRVGNRHRALVCCEAGPT